MSSLRPIRRIGAPVLHSPCKFFDFSSSTLNDDTNSSTSALITPLQATTDLQKVLLNFIQENGFGRAIAANQVGIPYSFLAIQVLGLDFQTGKMKPAEEISAEEKNKFKDSLSLAITSEDEEKKQQQTLLLSNCGGIIANPKFIWTSDKDSEIHEVWDDCFSFPETLVRVPRFKSVSIEFESFPDSATSTNNDINKKQNSNNSKIIKWESVNESLSELLQHEIDHLHGLTAFDRLAGRENEVSLPSLKSQMERIKMKNNDIDRDPVVISRMEFEKNPERFMKMLR